MGSANCIAIDHDISSVRFSFQASYRGGVIVTSAHRNLLQARKGFVEQATYVALKWLLALLIGIGT